MENTNTIQFENDQAEWFIAVGEKYRGPLKASEIYAKLQAKELSWIDYCYREQDGDWIRVADHPVFQALQPTPPKPKPMPPKAPPPPPKKVAEEPKWFLFQNDTQTGPYTATEVVRLGTASQLDAGAYVWQEGFSDWKPIQEVSELAFDRSTMAAAPKVTQPIAQPLSSEPSERRTAPRKPLVAQIYMTNQSEVSTGLCRDISVGGMQVLCDSIPGAVGSQVQFNVAPPKESGLAPFVAKGMIVRVLEDRRGFSFRFVDLSSEAKQSIESYIS